MFPREGKPFWEDPWTHEWEVFRRHLVDLHYDELSQWVGETGIESSQIFSSQGFNAPGKMIEPFPLRIDSPPKNYDTGGMSVMERSSIRMSPVVGGVKPATIMRVVVFPDPLGPSSVTNSPGATSRSTWSTAVTSPYRLVNPERTR